MALREDLFLKKFPNVYQKGFFYVKLWALIQEDREQRTNVYRELEGNVCVRACACACVCVKSPEVYQNFFKSGQKHRRKAFLGNSSLGPEANGQRWFQTFC